MSHPLYHTNRWRKKAAAQLRREPLCRFHLDRGFVEAARVADHLEPHKGDPHKFWNGALISLCVNCHSSLKQQMEDGATIRGCCVHGYSLDPRSDWYCEQCRGGDSSLGGLASTTTPPTPK